MIFSVVHTALIFLISVWYFVDHFRLFDIVMYVLCRFTDSDYPIGIIKLSYPQHF